MGTGLSPTDGRDLDGGPEEALFFLYALFLDLVSRGAIGDPITVTAAPARTSSSPDNNRLTIGTEILAKAARS